jgi:2-polyprenyl-6-methoxyphenol hydroxylase-like FAD-dependent oxidoreductase
MTFEVDVVVAGGGPVGLMLACELRIAGVSVAVLEQRTEVDPTIKAGSLNAPSVEALYRRGMLKALQEAQAENLERFVAFAKQRAQGEQGEQGEQGTGRLKFAGHFGGIMLNADRLDPDDPDLSGHGPAAVVSIVSQQQLEALLEARAIELGADVRRGVTLTRFESDPEGVLVATSHGEIRARWLVGCDGGRSTVRKLAGFDFPGTDPEITAYQALVELSGAENLGVGWNATDTGLYAHGPVPGRILTVEFGGVPASRDAPVTVAELETALRKVSGTDVRVTAVKTATRFTDNARQATTYRLGRVLLAGDAAHVHSPFGGQGLNLGLGDAMNLGWKLAATIRGWAPDGLIDTYTTERHPIGAWVLDWTRAQNAVMRPDPRARALRQVITDLTETVTGTTYFAKRLSGVWQRYDLPGDHPLTGQSAPDLELADGTRLADHLHSGHALLLDLTDDRDLRTRADAYTDRLNLVTLGTADRQDLTALLIRPDGFVAWAADTLTGDDLSSLDKALSTWLGTPG